MKLVVGMLLALILLAGAPAGTLQWAAPVLVVSDTVFASRPALAGRDSTLWAVWWQDTGTVAAQHDGNVWHPLEFVQSGGPAGVAFTLDDEHAPWIAYGRSEAREVQCVFTRRSADTWTRPAVFFRDTTIMTPTPALAPHPQRGVQAAWVNFSDPACLLTARGTSDSWTAPQVVNSFPGYLFHHHKDIARLRDGRLLVAWYCFPESGGRNLYTSFGSGDSWSRPVHVVFPSPQYGVTSTLVWMDASGVARIAWQALDTETMQDKLYSARFDGTQWVEPVLLDSGGSFVGCTDTAGWGWILYVRPNGQSVVRYHDGSNWTAPMPGPPDSLSSAGIGVAHGRIWVLWLKPVSETRALLYCSSAGHPLAVMDPPALPQQPSLPVASPSVIRAGTSLHLTGLRPGQNVQLLDAAGRKLNPQAEVLSTSSLPPGVYFLH
ncbi:MAG: sialidase family protein, partial [candidate division WOR-3 bacterium]